MKYSLILILNSTKPWCQMIIFWREIQNCARLPAAQGGTWQGRKCGTSMSAYLAAFSADNLRAYKRALSLVSLLEIFVKNWTGATVCAPYPPCTQQAALTPANPI